MTTLAVDTDITVPMRDGTGLRADVVRPSATGPIPAIVYRTPYDRTSFASVSLQVHALKMAAAGYAILLQDVRGRGGSEGRFEPFVNEQADGVDSIHWIAEQPWCNGVVGSVGISYNAFCQFAAAAAAPEPLAAWIPGLGPFDVRTTWIREGGAVNYGFHLAWFLGDIGPADPRTRDPNSLLDLFADPTAAARRVAADPELLQAKPALSVLRRWMEEDDPYRGDSRVPGPGDALRVSAPALVVAGWFDLFQPGSIDLYRALEAADPDAGHRLVAGPWGHTGLPLGRRAGDRDFGPAAARDLHSIQLSWFDTHLRGADPSRRRDEIFIGMDGWHAFDTWPPRGSEIDWCLNGDGSLGAPGPEAEVVLESGPDPAPAAGGRVFPWEPSVRPGSFDRTDVDRRDDVLVFDTDPLEDAVVVAGAIDLAIEVSAERGATDVVAVLSDVSPDGAAWNVADGVARVDADPEAIRAVNVSMGGAAHRFGAGHRIRVALSAAAFPRFDYHGGPGRRTFRVGGGAAVLRTTVI